MHRTDCDGLDRRVPGADPAYQEPIGAVTVSLLSVCTMAAVVSLAMAGCGGSGSPQRMSVPATVPDLIRQATGADAVRSGEPPLPITIGTEISHFVSSTQTFSGPRYAVVLPWRDDHGTLNLAFSTLAPTGFQGRFVDTATGAGIAFTEATPHAFGNDKRAFEIRKDYAGAGTLTVNVATDVNDGHVLERPLVDYGRFDRHIELTGIPALPAGLDWHGVPIPGPADEGTLAGSLDGVQGVFTAPDMSRCLPVVGCYMEFNRAADAGGYFPRGQVLFTPDDPAIFPTTLPDASPVVRPPRADYLAFGGWLYVPEDIASSREYDLGVFGGGGDPYSSSVRDLAGSATYVGSASGRYFVGRSSTSPRVGSFRADVTLTADFDDGTLGGRVENFRFDAAVAGQPTELRLMPATVMEPDPQSFRLAAGAAGTVTDGQPASPWAGLWRAAFFGNGEQPADLPTGVAGTFGASTDDRGLVGGFGARRHDHTD